MYHTTKYASFNRKYNMQSYGIFQLTMYHSTTNVLCNRKYISDYKYYVMVLWYMHLWQLYTFVN